MASYSGGLWHSRILLPGLHTFRTFTAVLSRIAVCSFRRESGTCMPPFFRTSAGHRVEGRNPWHLQHSRNQLHAGTHCRRLVRSLSLRPSWLLASWADQTERKLSLPKASTSGLPAPKSPCGLPDITTAPNGELRRQDLHLQVQQLVSLRSLPWVAWVSLPHLPRYYATLRLPPAPLGVLHLSLVPRYLACSSRSWCPRRARCLVEAPRRRQGLWSPGPPIRACRQGDRWLSQVPEFPL